MQKMLAAESLIFALSAANSSAIALTHYHFDKKTFSIVFMLVNIRMQVILPLWQTRFLHLEGALEAHPT